MGKLRSAFEKFWSWLRQVSGDDAYERYLETMARSAAADAGGPAGRVASREEFYVEMQRRKYKGVSRCC